MQKIVFILLVVLWITLSVSLSSLITPSGHSFLFLWLIAFFMLLPFALKPVNMLCRFFYHSPCISVRHHRRIHIHLSPLQKTVGISSSRLLWFRAGLIHCVTAALADKKYSVILASHLLTPARCRWLVTQFPHEYYRYRIRRVPFKPAARAIMQLEILISQWRWRSSFHHDWPVLVLRQRKRVE